MTIILYILIAYYLIQLCKSESLTKITLNKVGDSFKEGEEKGDKSKELDGCIGFIFVVLPFTFVKLMINIFLIYLIINGIKSESLLYPSIVMGVVYILNFAYTLITNAIKSKVNKDNKIEYKHTKTKRSLRGWINLFLILVYIIWYLIVI